MNEQIENKYKDTPILLIQLEKFQFSLTEKSILKHASLYSKCYGACVFQAYYGEFVQVFPGVDIDAGLYDKNRILYYCYSGKCFIPQKN